MTIEEPEVRIAAARSALAEWMRPMSGEYFTSDEALASAAIAELARRNGMELTTVWNPSACAFDARWTKEGRTPDGLEKPFSAEDRHGAQLLACIGLIKWNALAKAAAMLRIAEAAS